MNYLRSGIPKPVKHSEQISILKQRPFWSFFCLLVAWLFYYWPTLVTIYAGEQPDWIIWSTRGVTLASCLLIYAKHKALKNTLLVSSQLGLLALFILTIVFILGEIFNIQYAEQSSVMLMLPALVMTCFGPSVIRTLLIPLLYLMLVIPLQDNSILHRSVFIWIAVIFFIGYLQFLRMFKPKAESFETTPLWVFQNSRWLIPTAIAFSILMVSPWLGDNIRSFYPPKHKEIALRAPLGTNGWIGPTLVKSDAWKPEYINASSILQAEYFNSATSDRDTIYLYTAYYDSDRSFADMFDEKNSIFNPSLWKEVGTRTMKISVGNDSIVVFEATLQAGAVTRLVWYWYYIAGISTIDLNLANLLDKVRIISKYAQGSGLISVSTTFAASPDEARGRLNSYLTVMYGALDILKRPEITYTTFNHAGK